jgi:hypothetical protein
MLGSWCLAEVGGDRCVKLGWAGPTDGLLAGGQFEYPGPGDQVREACGGGEADVERILSGRP